MRPLTAVISALLAVVLVCAQALAQDEPKRSPLGLPMPPSAGQASPSGAEPPGMMSRAWAWVQGMQQKLNRDMAAAVKELKAAGSANAAWVLAFIAFTYGVLHAAGPGHGKAVISSYVLANERTVRRGIFLSFLAALFQAISAIAIVGVLAIALNATSLTIKATEHWIETVSWGLVALIGAWMLYTQVRPLLARWRHGTPGHGAAALGAEHDDPPGTLFQKHERQGHGRHGHPPQHQAHDCCKEHDHHHHHHAHAHAHDHGADHAECCGHAHMPAPKDLEGDMTWRKAIAIAGSVGIRPCTGAIIVLIFALSQGMLWAGVFATFAMALGTAITTSTLAALAVGSKELATRYAGEGSRLAGHIGTAAGLTGSSLVLLLGLSFFFASLNGPAPL